ncbi:hypothetical protein CHS0354_000978 [Potamilus streckersoni]|uniref:Cadherin domain-containing protein n=1 Tax=Potamilus streckersoni TaxID=2493646 RepID=A0AAE0SJ05_9BIVA|nr:hypothetical protein CHS0354_000978 [Potamilus streckersoni]
MGHFTAACIYHARCHKCGEHHQVQRKTHTYICANCRGPHTPYSADTPREKRIIQLMEKNKPQLQSGTTIITTKILFHQRTTTSMTTANPSTPRTTNPAPDTSTQTRLNDNGRKPQDINTKPLITNLPPGSAVSVWENDIMNHVFYQVSLSDPDIGDTHTWSMTFSPVAGGQMFQIGTSNGTISTAAVLDYETLAVKTFSAAITVTDGRETSDAHVLSITVMDVNEAPSLSSTSYVITTQEVPGGTSLGNSGIFSTDPDAGDIITYSIACGSDSGYLSVIPTTGFVTMITAFDLDSQSLAIYTIGCTLTCTDSGGLMDTSSLNVTITDTNDNTPQFSQAMYSFTLAVSSTVGTHIGQVTATDRDVSANNNRLSFALSSTTVFNIDSGGNIILTGLASIANPYILTVTATDSGGLSSTSMLQVLVITNSASTTENTNKGFFSYTENIVWFTFALVLGAGMFGMMGYMLYHYCKMKILKSERQIRNAQSKMPNQQKGVETKINELTAKPGTPLGSTIRVSQDTRPWSPLQRVWSPRVSSNTITPIYVTPSTPTFMPNQAKVQLVELMQEKDSLKPGSSFLIENYHRHIQGK